MININNEHDCKKLKMEKMCIKKRINCKEKNQKIIRKIKMIHDSFILNKNKETNKIRNCVLLC